MTARTPLAATSLPSASSHRAAVSACFGSLFVIGVYAALWGPALPELSRQAGVSLGDAGALFSVVFATAILSTAVAGAALDRFGRRWPLVVGLTLEGLALLAFPFVNSWTGLLALAALLGLGDGAIVVAVHVLVADLNPEREAQSLNHLNVAFGVGAVAGPVLGALAVMVGVRAVVVFVLAGALQLGYAAVLAASAMPVHTRHEDGGGAFRLLRSGLLWLLSMLLLVYVGVELGLGAWAFTYARRTAGLGGTEAALLSSGFWCALTLGRLLSPLVLRRLSPEALLVAAPILSAAGTLALTLGGAHAPVLIAGVLVTGLGFGPVWPVTFALATRAFPSASGSASGVLGMVSSLGGLVLPWLQGRVLESVGPTAGISVTLAGCVVVALLAGVVRRTLERPA